MNLTIHTLPISTNHLYGGNGKQRFLLRNVVKNKESIAWDARTQYRGSPLKGALALRVELYWPTKANHDVDNIKILLDACTGILWDDDGQIIDLHITKAYDKENPRVELTLWEV